ncbi:MAG TPA: TonB-dependent receptor, partial [Marinilabiliaceae bacterium]|nr:TonB-dependent receptor [Marinilabiliaceae bacterium]
MRNWSNYLLLGLLILLFPFNSLAQTRCVEGKILDEATGMPISDVQIYCPLSNRGAVTNDQGEFKICEIVENALLEINHLAYYPQVIYVSDSAMTFISLSLKVREVITDEVVIKGLSGNLSKEIMPGRGKLSTLDIIQLPSFLGQPDVVRSLQTMAGVQTVSEGVGDIFVRGGAPGQNLILLDGMELMNPVHLMGIYSIFNPFTTNSVDLFKGHAPASLGSRLSSVISVFSTEPTIAPSEFSGSIGNVATSLGLTQKSKDGKWGVVMGLRRSFLELYKPITSLFLSAEDDFFKSNSYYFYDFNGRFVYQPKATTSFSLNCYWGKDFFKMENHKINYLTETDFGSGALSFVWNQSITKRMKFKWDVGYTQAWAGFSGMVIDNNIGFNSNHLKLYTGIQLSGEHNRHSWSVGSKISRYSTLPQEMLLVVESDTSNFYNKFENAQVELFLEDSYKLNDKLILYGGLRTHYYKTLGPYDFIGSNESNNSIKKGESSKGDFYFSPSISMQYLMENKDQLKWAWSRNVQMIHVASLSSMPLPNDMWMMATPQLKPQTGHQFSIGYYKQLEGYSFSSELFAKSLSNQTVFNIDLEGNEINFEDNFFVGEGRVFGLELTGQKEIGAVKG